MVLRTGQGAASQPCCPTCTCCSLTTSHAPFGMARRGSSFSPLPCPGASPGGPPTRAAVIPASPQLCSQCLFPWLGMWNSITSLALGRDPHHGSASQGPKSFRETASAFHWAPTLPLLAASCTPCPGPPATTLPSWSHTSLHWSVRFFIPPTLPGPHEILTEPLGAPLAPPTQLFGRLPQPWSVAETHPEAPIRSLPHPCRHADTQLCRVRRPGPVSPVSPAAARLMPSSH